MNLISVDRKIILSIYSIADKTENTIFNCHDKEIIRARNMLGTALFRNLARLIKNIVERDLYERFN